MLQSLYSFIFRAHVTDRRARKIYYLTSYNSYLPNAAKIIIIYIIEIYNNFLRINMITVTPGRSDFVWAAVRKRIGKISQWVLVTILRRKMRCHTI